MSLSIWVRLCWPEMFLFQWLYKRQHFSPVVQMQAIKPRWWNYILSRGITLFPFVSCYKASKFFPVSFSVPRQPHDQCVIEPSDKRRTPWAQLICWSTDTQGNSKCPGQSGISPQSWQIQHRTWGRTVSFLRIGLIPQGVLNEKSHPHGCNALKFA